MKSFFVAFLAFMAVTAVAANGPWSDCGSPKDHIKINSLTINPATLSPGQQFTVAFDGKLDETVTGGKASVTVTFLGIPVFTKTYELCELLGQVGQSCPVQAGPISAQKTEQFPQQVPKGTYKGQIKMVDQNGQQLACINFNMGVKALLNHEPILSNDIIESVNALQKEWVAERSPRFEGVTIGEIRNMLRTRVNNPLSTVPVSNDVAELGDIPDSFDGRTEFKGMIGDVRDQARCGSCWAFSSSSALADRYNILHKKTGANRIVLSPQWQVSCDSKNYGCQGGYLDLTWAFLVSNGIPTDACAPYTSGAGVTGTCPTACKDGSAPVFYKAQGPVQHPTSVAAIQSAVMSTGPVQVAFDVYQDFMSYKSGVYSHTTGSYLGGHAVELVGWTVVNGTPAWIIKNSWGTSWGESGYFMIKRGVNMCGIESRVYFAGAP